MDNSLEHLHFHIHADFPFPVVITSKLNVNPSLHKNKVRVQEVDLSLETVFARISLNRDACCGQTQPWWELWDWTNIVNLWCSNPKQWANRLLNVELRTAGARDHSFNLSILSIFKLNTCTVSWPTLNVEILIKVALRWAHTQCRLYCTSFAHKNPVG